MKRSNNNIWISSYFCWDVESSLQSSGSQGSKPEHIHYATLHTVKMPPDLPPRKQYRWNSRPCSLTETKTVQCVLLRRQLKPYPTVGLGYVLSNSSMPGEDYGMGHPKRKGAPTNSLSVTHERHPTFSRSPSWVWLQAGFSQSHCPPGFQSKQKAQGTLEEPGPIHQRPGDSSIVPRSTGSFSKLAGIYCGTPCVFLPMICFSIFLPVTCSMKQCLLPAPCWTATTFFCLVLSREQNQPQPWSMTWTIHSHFV